MINYFLCFKQQEEELSQARDELNKIREEETKLEREASFKWVMFGRKRCKDCVSSAFYCNCNSLQIAAFFVQIEASKEHLETVQKQIKSVQTEVSQVSNLDWKKKTFSLAICMRKENKQKLQDNYYTGVKCPVDRWYALEFLEVKIMLYCCRLYTVSLMFGEKEHKRNSERKADEVAGTWYLPPPPQPPTPSFARRISVLYCRQFLHLLWLRRKEKCSFGYSYSIFKISFGSLFTVCWFSTRYEFHAFAWMKFTILNLILISFLGQIQSIHSGRSKQ